MTRKKLEPEFSWFWFAEKCPVRDKKLGIFILFWLGFYMHEAKAIGNESYHQSEILSSHSSRFRAFSASGDRKLYQNKLRIHGPLLRAILTISLPQETPKLLKMGWKHILRTKWPQFHLIWKFSEFDNTSLSRTGQIMIFSRI